MQLFNTELPLSDFDVNLITAFKVDVKMEPQKSSFHGATKNVVDNVADNVVDNVVDVARNVARNVAKNVVKVDITQLTDRQVAQPKETLPFWQNVEKLSEKEAVYQTDAVEAKVNAFAGQPSKYKGEKTRTIPN